MIKQTNDQLKSKDFASDQEVKWCPGCGDYSVLSQVQKVLAEEHCKKENTVFISGIGCSSRFTYYMDTYGIHGIHGRALPIATGLKLSRPELNIWVVTGDGDCLSIGGNHFIHTLRKNFNFNIFLLNNGIYALTKGQFSPTSEQSKITKSSPYGVPGYPFIPAALALGAGGSFISRTIDREPRHMQETLKRAHQHQGTSFIEVYQNCNIFNDGAYQHYTDKAMKEDTVLFLEQGQPLLFGKDQAKALRLDGNQPVIVDAKDYASEELWIHDVSDKFKAWILTHFDEFRLEQPGLPQAFGVLYAAERPAFESIVQQQTDAVLKKRGKLPLNKILAGSQTWVVG